MVTKKLDPVLYVFGILLINLILILLFAGIILKFAFKAYFPIAGEVPFNILPLLPIFLVGILWKKRSIIMLDAFYVHYGKKTKYIFDLIFDVAGIAIGVSWVMGAIQLVVFDLQFTQLTYEMFVNWAWYHAPFALGLVFFVVYVIEDFVKVIANRQQEVS